MISLNLLTKNSLTVAKYTFLEIYKSKIMINVLFLGLVQIMLSYVASEFTYGVPQKVALEFGLGITTISSIGIAIFMGATLLSHEVNNRTVYLILSRPISRQSFIFGKFLGLGAILFLDVFILGTMTLSFFLFLGGKIDPMLLVSIFFIYLESLIMLLVVIFFSLFNNITLSVIFSIAVYFAGHSLQKVILFWFKKDDIMTFILVIFSYFLPNLSKLNLKDYVLYKQTLEPELLLQIGSYGFLYILILISLNMFIFSRKNLD